MFRTDRGGEFTSNEFMQYCKENGIARQLTATYMPQNYGAEAVRHAIYILNNVPTKALEDITPYEAIKQRKPNLGNLGIEVTQSNGDISIKQSAYASKILKEA
ncbi:zinc finger, CCHC-type containing protein, partial [Tanacetum coccineum]